MNLEPWSLIPDGDYIINGDAEVKLLMLKFGVPDLFDSIKSTDKAQQMFVAFDNHPTHWIIFYLWKNQPEYSPNHGVHKLAKGASANGLLFQALPKSAMTQADFAKHVQKEQDYKNSPVRFSQLPIF